MKHPPFAAQLPYGPMVTDRIVLLHEPPHGRKSLSHFALGALWSITPRNIDVLPEDTILQLSRDVQAMLFLLPMGAVFEVRLDILPTTQVPEWEGSRAGIEHPEVAWQRAHLAAGMRHHTSDGIARLRHYKVTVGLRLPLSTHVPQEIQDWLLLWQFWRMQPLMERFEKQAQATLASAISTFENVAAGVESRLALLQTAPQRLDGAGIVAAIGVALHPLAHQTPLYTPVEPLRTQPALEQPQLFAGGYRVGETLEAHVFSLRKSPPRAYPGILAAPRTPRDTFHGFDPWTLAGEWPLSLVVQCTMTDQYTLRNTFSHKQSFAFAQRRGTRGEDRVETAQQEVSLKRLIERMSSGIEKVLPTGVHLIVWGPQSDERPMDYQVMNAGAGLSLEWLYESHMGNTYFVRTLPLGCDPEYPHERWLQRMKHLPTDMVAALLPVWGSFRGTTGHPPVVYANRRGEAVLFNPFDLHLPHMTIVGASRSGKSMGFNHLLHQLLPLGASAFILDRYGSYEGLCAIHGGHHIRFDINEPLCLGPFAGPLDAQHRAMLTYLLAEMCAGSNSEYALRPEEFVLLGRLIRHWVATRDPLQPQTISAFVETVQASPIHRAEQLCERLELLLSPYCGDGEYAGFTDGPDTLCLTEGLWVFDISELEKMPGLQAVLIMMLFDRFERIIRSPAMEHIMKFIGADEVSFLLRNPKANEFLGKLSRALARFHCSFVLLSQLLSDFYTDIGRVILGNTGAFFFHHLSGKEIVDMSSVYDLGEEYASLIENLRRHEDCSEALLYIPEGDSGIVRIVPDHELVVRIGQAEAHKRARAQRQA